MGLIAHDLSEGVIIRHQALLAQKRKLTLGNVAFLRNSLLHLAQQFGNGRMAAVGQMTEDS